MDPFLCGKECYGLPSGKEGARGVTLCSALVFLLFPLMAAFLHVISLWLSGVDGAATNDFDNNQPLIGCPRSWGLELRSTSDANISCSGGEGFTPIFSPPYVHFMEKGPRGD